MKTAASVGNTKYSRVQGSAAIGSAEENGWGSAQRGRQPADDDDDGSGMAWLKRRREERERAKAEAAEKAAAEAAVQDAVEMQEDVKDDHAEEKHDAEVADPDPPAPVTQEKQVEEAAIDAVESKTESEEQPTPIAVSEDAEHVTTAVKIPAHTPSPRHHSLNLGHHPHGHPMRLSAERTPSFASRHSIPRTPERRGSADTARAGSPIPQSIITDAQVVVGELEGLEEQKEEEAETIRERRESQSSTSTGSEDEDADAEYSPKSEDEDDDEVSILFCAAFLEKSYSLFL